MLNRAARPRTIVLVVAVVAALWLSSVVLALVLSSSGGETPDTAVPRVVRGPPGATGQRRFAGPAATDYADEIDRLIDATEYLCGSLTGSARETAESALAARVAAAKAANAEIERKAAEAEAERKRKGRKVPPSIVIPRHVPTRGSCD